MVFKNFTKKSNQKKLFLGLHFCMANEGIIRAVFFLDVRKLANNHNSLSLFRIPFGVLARFRKFKSKALRAAGKSIRDNATIKTLLDLVVVITRENVTIWKTWA